MSTQQPISDAETAEPEMQQPDPEALRAEMLDPYPWFRSMREQQPLIFDERNRMWQAFRYEDIHRIITDYEVFSSDLFRDQRAAQAESGMPVTNNLIVSDPPLHRQLRELVSQAFTPRAVNALEPRIAEITRELLDEVTPRGRMDLVDDLSYPLPVIVIAEMLGVPSADRADFKRWSDAVITNEEVDRTSPQRSSTLPHEIEEMRDYFSAMIAERQRAPTDDLISQLIAARLDGEQLSHEDLLNFAILMLVAGNITTTNLIANAIWCFDEHPEAWQQLRAQPALLPGAIEEVLRYRSPVKAMLRIVKQETTFAGLVLHADQSILTWVGSANRDEAQFPDADRFDITRQPNRHIAFGHGIHFCLGAPLARLEARVALEIMLDRFATIRRDRDVPLTPCISTIIHGLEHLPVTFTLA